LKQIGQNKTLLVDDFPVLTSIAKMDRWCQEMPQSINKLPFEEIIEFVNNPPDRAQYFTENLSRNRISLDLKSVEQIF
jgi:hypothetical protein